MGRHNSVESLSRMLQIVKLLGKDGGATVTQIADATGIDRWTVRNMIDSLEEVDADGRSFCIEEYKNPDDNRQTYYQIPHEHLWSLTLPGLNLTEEEGMLLSVLIDQAKHVPVLKDAAEGLQSKINWLNDISDYSIRNVNATEKIVGPEAKETVSTILKAIRNEDCIEFNYKHPADCFNGHYKVMPLYMFAYDGGLYMNGQKLPSGDLKTYAVERIQNIPTLSDVKVEDRPERLPYDGRLEDPFGPFWDHEEFELEVVFDFWQGWYNMQKRWPDSVTVAKNDDGTVTLKAKTRNLYGSIRWLMGQCKNIRGISPQWFKDACVKSINADMFPKVFER